MNALRVAARITGLLAVLVLILALLALGWLTATPAGARWAVQTALTFAPGDTHVDAIEGSLMRGFTLIGLKHASPTASLQVRAAGFSWSPLHLLRGELRIAYFRAQGVRAKVVTNTASEEQKPFTIPSLPLRIRLGELRIEDTDIEAQEKIYRIESLSLSALLADQTLQVAQTKLHTGPVRIEAAFDLDLRAPFATEAALTWTAEIDASQHYGGKLELRGDLNRLDIHHRPAGERGIVLEGWVGPVTQQGHFSLQGRWNALHWPLAGMPEFRTPTGQFAVEGTADAYTVSLSGKVQQVGGFEADIDLRSHGDRASLAVESLRADVLQGQLKVQGKVGWQPALNWDLALQGERLNPGVLHPDYTGRLEFQGKSQGRSVEQQLEFQAQIRPLRGRLGERTLTGNADLSAQGSNYRLSALDLKLGRNHLQASGSLDRTLDLSLKVQAPELNALHTALAGSVQGDARISGDLRRPALKAMIQAHSLRYAQHGLAEMTIDLDYDPRAVRASHARILALGVSSGGQHLQSVELKLEGTEARHQLVARIDSTLVKLDLLATGKYTDSAWNGQLEQLQLTTPDFGDWRLDQAAAIRIEPPRFSLSRACLRQEAAHVCAEAAAATTGKQTATAEMEGVPLALLSGLMPSALNARGALRGRAQWSQQAAQAAQWQAELSLDAGALSYALEPETPLEFDWESLQLKADSRAGDAKVQVDLRMPQEDFLSADIRIGNYAQTGTLLGNTSARLSRLDRLSALTPDLVFHGGALNLDARLSGTLTAPQVTGQARLTDADIDVPRAGLEIKDIELSAQANGSEVLVLAGRARSGPGSIDLQGKLRLDAAAGWPLDLSLKGQNFELAHLPEGDVRASPDLTLTSAQGLSTVSGRVRLDTLDVRIRPLPKSAIAVSPDERIVGVSDAPAATAPQQLRMRIELEVPESASLKGLGLDTHLQGVMSLSQDPGAPLGIQGALTLKDGRYEAFGQELGITRGRFTFTGPPADPGIDLEAERVAGEVTAGLRVSGTLKSPVTEVYSRPPLPEDQALSYLLLGKPLSGASSGESDLLAKAALALGARGANPFAKRIGNTLGLDELGLETGDGLDQTGLALGKQISSRVNLRYVYGLFDRVGAILLEYRLTDSLSLEAQTGTSQTVDLLYRLERN